MQASLAQSNAYHEQIRDNYFYDGDVDLHAAEFIQVNYKKGQLLFVVGMMPNQLYLIMSGMVKVYKSGFDGKEQIIKVLYPGDFVGYRELITGGRYEVSAETVEESVIKLIPKTDFMIMYDKNQTLRQQFTQYLCRDVNLLEQKLLSTAYSPLPSRLAEALLVLANQNAGKELYAIKLTRHDIARYIATTKESVIRLISDLKKSGILDATRNRITVKNPDALMRIRDLNQ